MSMTVKRAMLALAAACLAAPATANEQASMGHLSYGDDPSTEMRFTFATPNTTSADYVPVLRYGLSASSLNESAVMASAAPVQCGLVYGSAYHYAKMSGLLPATQYFYAYGSNDKLSSTFFFMTAPKPESKHEAPSRFAVFGDMGVDYSSNSQLALSQLADAGDLDFVIHDGDISYADNRFGEDNGTHYIDFMDLFYHNMSNAYSQRVPVMMSPGNHEWPCNYTEYETRAHNMPFQGSGSSSPHYYSYVHGNVMVVALSGEQGRLDANNTEEYKWMKTTLERGARLKAEGKINWLVTHIHYPTAPYGYCSYNIGYCCGGGPSECLHVQTQFFNYTEDLFVKAQVDVHFTAHEHVYERTYPMYRHVGYSKESGSQFNDPIFPMYVVSGSPGNTEVFASSWDSEPEWGIPSRTTSFGFTSCQASADTLACQYVAVNQEVPGKVVRDNFDSFTITKSELGQKHKALKVSNMLD